jgi:hypothetical protein
LIKNIELSTIKSCARHEIREKDMKTKYQVQNLIIVAIVISVITLFAAQNANGLLGEVKQENNPPCYSNHAHCYASLNNVDHARVCPDCKGARTKIVSKKIKCNMCNGDGIKDKETLGDNKGGKCSYLDCNGTGKVTSQSTKKCGTCDGTGEV